MPATRSRPWMLIALHLALAAAALLCLVPFAWLVCASFKGPNEMFTYAFLPWDRLGTLTLANYTMLITTQPFLTWVVNSLFLSCTHTLLVVTLSSLGGFALAKYRFKGKGALMLIMLVTMLIPGQVLLPSSYELMYHLGWIDSYAAILVPGAVSVFGIFLFRGAMQAVPDELLQAGRIDGCSELRLWWDIALPCVRPMIGAFTLMSFTSAWNNFLWPQIVLQSEARYHLPIGLASMIGLPAYDVPHGMLMAGTLLSVLPVMLLFFILQKDFIAGLTAGSVKG
jgi:ABC-type glycerol-3-phosphate transport system permease component